jgi:myosin tail region-interacting protein MTI1
MSAVLFRVKAIYEYASPHDDDLSFPNGQIISVTAEEDDDWYAGEFIDAAGHKQEGIFPRNFVDKYEPEIPSRPARPTRAKKDADPSTPVAAAEVPTESSAEAPAGTQERAQNPAQAVGPLLGSSNEAAISSPRVGGSASPPSTKSSTRQSAAAGVTRSSDQTQPSSAGKDDQNHQPSEKPTGDSFKDRIAAFNKSAASPIAPFKPGGHGKGSSTSFIKKPFVAPPPSKNAYVPPPREALPAKTYRREEDPELKEAAEDSEASVPLLDQREQAPTEEEAKTTSLKDRIALLQKQQLEQAALRADAAQKKDKPKRPPKKRMESQERTQNEEHGPQIGSTGLDPAGTIGKKSVDFADDESESLGRHDSRQKSGIAPVATPPPPSRELVSDTNDADYSAAGDTEEGYDTSTSREDDRQKRRSSQQKSTEKGSLDENVEVGSKEREPQDEEEDEEGEVEEDQEEVDPEVKRRLEIRERMAKMSGGMGLMGMFGPPGGIPAAARKARASGTGEPESDPTQGESVSAERAPPVPVPGMSNTQRTDSEALGVEEDGSADEEAVQTPSQHTEDKGFGPASPPQRTATDRTAPPVPQGMPETCRRQFLLQYGH